MATLAKDSLRPASMDRFIGQAKLKNVLQIAINGANARKEPVGHCLFVGPPGLGKTTLANIIAQATEKNLLVASGPSIQKIGTLVTLLNQAQGGDTVVFVDEVHAMPRIVEEAMYTVLEDYRLDITTDKMHVNVNMAPFTFVGATTRFGKLTKPLRDRFPNHFHLDWYSQPEMEAIVIQSARALGIEIEQKAVETLAHRAKRTPRIVNNFLLKTRDFALQYGIHHVSLPVVLGMFESLEIDENGLGPIDRRILEIIIDKFRGGPVGIDSLASAMVEEVDVIEQVYEPYLVQCTFLQRTPRGREVTAAGYKAVGRDKKPAGLRGVI